jgi:hypothetical protein
MVDRAIVRGAAEGIARCRADRGLQRNAQPLPKVDITHIEKSTTTPHLGCDSQLHRIAIRRGAPVHLITIFASEHLVETGGCSTLRARRHPAPRMDNPDDGPGWYLNVTDTAGGLWWCGPYATFDRAKQSEQQFLAGGDACSDPLYYNKRPTTAKRCVDH